MSSDVDLLVRGAKADFQAAGHKPACASDLHTMCWQIEDMVQSIALGLNGLTEVLCVMKERIDQIEVWMNARQTAQSEQAVQSEHSNAHCLSAR